MTVSKCDRCGVYVDSETIPKIRATLKPNAIHVPGNKDILMDLCFGCYYELEKFLKINKEEMENVDQAR